MKFWQKKEAMDESELLKYKEDRKSEIKFRARFTWLNWLVVGSVIFLVYSMFEHWKEPIVGISFFVLFGSLVVLAVAHRFTKAVCGNCSSFMVRHHYSNNDPEYLLGVVYLCSNCKTKFIFNAPRIGDGGGPDGGD